MAWASVGVENIVAQRVQVWPSQRISRSYFWKFVTLASTTVWRDVILPKTEKCHDHPMRQRHRDAPGKSTKNERCYSPGPIDWKWSTWSWGDGEMCKKADAIVVSIL